jgi:hypothetical protein
MANRHFTLNDYFIQKEKENTPSLTFSGSTYLEWMDWKERLKSKLLELLGEFPECVPMKVERVWKVEEDGIIKEKLLIDTEQFATIPLIMTRSSDLDMEEKHKALLCIHGHGPYGKDSVAGIRCSDDRIKKIEEANYDFGLQFAKQGYITFSPDIRNFGERADEGNPYPGRDSCNVHFIRGLLIGVPLITLNLWDLKVVLSFIEEQSYVDSERIGCMGLSLGGTLTMHLTAIDERIKAADIICGMSTYEEYAIKMGNFCGSQFVPNIYKYGDLKDIAGLIAPRPLLIESGIHDNGFPIEASLKAVSAIEKIYNASGNKEYLYTDIFDGAHEFSGRIAFGFFEKFL